MNTLTKIKIQLAKLDSSELKEFRNWLNKKIGQKQREELQKATEEHDRRIKSLSADAEVMYTNSAFKLAGHIGKVVRHTRKYTIVDFDEFGIWRIPRMHLTTDINKEKADNLKMSYRMSQKLTSVFQKLTADRRPRCWACKGRLDKGESKRFLDEGVFKAHGVRNYYTMHKYRKDCGNKKQWTEMRRKLKAS